MEKKERERERERDERNVETEHVVNIRNSSAWQSQTGRCGRNRKSRRKRRKRLNNVHISAFHSTFINRENLFVLPPSPPPPPPSTPTPSTSHRPVNYPTHFWVSFSIDKFRTGIRFGGRRGRGWVGGWVFSFVSSCHCVATSARASPPLQSDRDRK